MSAPPTCSFVFFCILKTLLNTRHSYMSRKEKKVYKKDDIFTKKNGLNLQTNDIKRNMNTSKHKLNNS